MKLITIASALLALSTNTALADGTPGSSNKGIVVDVEEVYDIKLVPEYQTSCYYEQVPYYQNAPSNTGDVMAGALIGGVIGNQFGGGNGKDAMTVLGAIVGAGVADQPTKRLAGYTDKQVCNTYEVLKEVYEFSHYSVTYAIGNAMHTFTTYNKFYVGDTVTIK